MKEVRKSQVMLKASGIAFVAAKDVGAVDKGQLT